MGMPTIFEKRFGFSAKRFKSTAEVDTFMAEEYGHSGVALVKDQNLVVPQGNVFDYVDYDTDALIAAACDPPKGHSRKK